jgi:hypothetical protein
LADCHVDKFEGENEEIYQRFREGSLKNSWKRIAGNKYKYTKINS